MGESLGMQNASSNFRGDKSVTKKIRLPRERRISFKDLAKFAVPHKTEHVIAGATGDDPRTVKRWFAKRSRAPANALQFVLGEIIRQLD